MTPTHAQTLSKLQDFYPHDDFPDRTVARYAQELRHLPPESLAHAVDNIIRRSRFMPKLSEILREVAELELGLPTPEQAWQIAESGSLREAHQCVRDAAEHVGGRWQILHSDNIPTVRSQFLRAYGRLREDVLNEYRTGTARVLPPGLQPLGPTMASLPETTRIRPRPIMSRLHHHWAGHDLEAPTEEEKHDAIEVLREGSTTEDPLLDPLYAMAERVFVEGAA